MVVVSVMLRWVGVAPGRVQEGYESRDVEPEWPVEGIRAPSPGFGIVMDSSVTSRQPSFGRDHR